MSCSSMTLLAVGPFGSDSFHATATGSSLHSRDAVLFVLGGLARGRCRVRWESSRALCLSLSLSPWLVFPSVLLVNAAHHRFQLLQRRPSSFFFLA